jgi:two-component system sensor histidine kinase KdpD
MAELGVVVDEGEAQAVQPAGRFRIYLGAAAGVGKTCAMLDEGRRRHERGRDVVVGFVETHGRAHTAELIGSLEVVPRKKVEYRGATFEEMDLDAVLARRPEIALVDELAHTNVPGSGRNEKRWQDALELLEAGIAVVSNVNIQHLESIADAVERITGVAIRERVPDWVVRRADQLELVDSSPEQLRRRMLHGNIYPAAKVPAALGGFFRTENLVALRELALRFVADETEEDLLEFLASRHVEMVWETAERIMVAVTGAPGTDAVLRRAARIAARVKADLLVVHVASDDVSSKVTKEAVEQARRLAEDVDGHWFDVRGEDPARALVVFAREHQITQIVLGSSRRSRLEELTKGSVVSRVLRFAAEEGIDVHVIARRTERELEQERERGKERGRDRERADDRG